MSNDKSNKPLRVMLVDDEPQRRELLESALREVDCALVACASGDSNLLSAVGNCAPDVILIDCEAPGRDTLESLESVQSTVPRPMVMFSRDDDHRTIRRATRAGVSAYVVDGLQTARVRPIIDAAIARFQHFNQLESELKKARRQLAERKTIDRAKGIIMSRRGVTEEQAYQAMRKLAMDTGRTLADVARSIVETADLLSP